MDLVIVAVGINHETAPVSVRERFGCKPKNGILEELAYLSNLPWVEEVVILSTCNRVEIFAVLKEEERIKDLLKEFIYLKTSEWNENWEKYFFVKTGEEAVKHILALPSGLLSMVVGETQIASQFKESFEIAKRQKTLGTILGELYRRALKTAKRVRSETAISKTPVSVSYIAVLLAKRVFGFLEGVRVLVVGAGEMAELTAQYLKRERAKIFVTNRTFERATELAKKVGGSVVEWEGWKDFLRDTDIAIISTGATDYIITAPEVEKLFRRRTSPFVFIDISVPRNVDPRIGNLEGVFLFNIDDLKEIADKNLQTRKEEAKKGFLIVEEEAKNFLKWLENKRAGDRLKVINQMLETLKGEVLKETDTPEGALELLLKRLRYPLFKTLRKHPEVMEEFENLLKEVLKNTSEGKRKIEQKRVT